MNTSPTSDEKIMAALAHGSILFMFLGPVVPVAVWASQRKKSKYVCFHALQAMGYQAFMFWLWIAVMILVMVLAMCLAFPLTIAMAKDSRNGAFAPFVFQIFVILSILGPLGLFFLTGIVGAVSCLLGHDFRYPLLGKRLERYLTYDLDSESQIDETQEDNWVAGVCHATAILQLWGVITPLVVWFTQKKRSARLRFQAMQAFVYQGITLVTYLVGMVLYILSLFGLMISMVLTAGTADNGGEIQGPMGLIMLIFFVAIVIFWLIISLLMPIYYLLAGFASLRVIQGRPFHYPILGSLLERWMGMPQKLEAAP